MRFSGRGIRQLASPLPPEAPQQTEAAGSKSLRKAPPGYLFTYPFPRGVSGLFINFSLSMTQSESPDVLSATVGRSLSTFKKACAGQVECKRLVSTDANGWSVAMQMSGQVHAVTQYGK